MGNLPINKLVKYILAIVAVWFLIIVAGLIFSRSVQDKIVTALTEQANKYLACEIHVRKSDIHFSVFQKFPLASVELKNVYARVPASLNLSDCITEKGDTLLFAKKVYLQLNLISLLGNNYELRKISINNGHLQVLTDKNGKSSLEILKKRPDNGKQGFSANIKSFSATALDVYTYDAKKLSYSQIFFEKGSASGSFSPDNFLIKLKTNGILKKFVAKNQKLEPNQHFEIDIALENKNENYLIKKGVFSFSNIPFKATGYFNATNDMFANLDFSASKVPLRQIDKALLKGLLGENGVELRSGTLDIRATIKGQTKKQLPSIKTHFKITEGKIFERKNNIVLSDVYLTGKANNGKEHLPKTTSVMLDTFYFKTGNSAQWGRLKLENLISPQIAISSTGKIFYADIKELVKIKDVTVNSGEFENQIAIAAIINKNKQPQDNILQDITLRAKIDIINLIVDFPRLNIPTGIIKGKIELTENNILNINNLQFNSGQSDFTLNGKLKNFLEAKPIPVYEGSIHSGHFQADEFLGVNSSNNNNSGPIRFPDSIRVSGNMSISSFAYGKFQTNNAKGFVDYQSQNAVLSGFSMNGFDGSVSGMASIGQNKEGDIELFTDVNLTGVDIKKLLQSTNNFNQDFIGHQHLDGKISGNVKLAIAWTNTLDFIPSSVTTQANVLLAHGRIREYEPLLGLSGFVNVEELKDIRFDNLAANITIHNQQVFLEQTRVTSSALSFDCAGVHGFDNKYEYRLQLALSDFLWKKAKSKNSEITEFGYIVNDGTHRTIIPVIISGIGTTFEVKYDKKTARTRFKEKIEQEKNVLQQLFSGKSVETSNNLPSDENTTSENQPAVLQKTDSGKYRTRSNEFILEWDDSEDNGQGNDY
ncbi:MAG: hypothetical protein JXB34_04975 [Bacteroidales bacterium]|nr:hypothetical protein [Bacteroidales bacterium]